MNNKEWDQKTLDKLHQVHQELLDEFDRICKKNKLTYFLIGGTYIGALRHNGFIPWDDDVDVAMPRKDYEKLIEVSNKDLNKKYYLDCFEKNNDYFFPFAKLKKNNTIFDEEVMHHLNNHKGIYIDIFPLDNVKENNAGLRIRAILAKAITDTMLYKNKVKKLGSALHPIVSFFFLMFTKKRLMKMQKNIVTYCHDDNSKYMCDIAFGYGVQKELIERCHVIPTRELPFNGKKYSCMHDDTFLKNIYGDYMKIPPVEKRKSHRPLKIDFGGNNEKERKKANSK